ILGAGYPLTALLAEIGGVRAAYSFGLFVTAVACRVPHPATPAPSPSTRKAQISSVIRMSTPCGSCRGEQARPEFHDQRFPGRSPAVPGSLLPASPVGAVVQTFQADHPQEAIGRMRMTARQIESQRCGGDGVEGDPGGLVRGGRPG